MRLTALGGSVSQMATGSCTVKLADFEVIKQLGTGANAFAYLAKCRAGGQLDAHQDMMAVLKVIVETMGTAAARREAQRGREQEQEEEAVEAARAAPVRAGGQQHAATASPA